jgi:hypothetical protein
MIEITHSSVENEPLQCAWKNEIIRNFVILHSERYVDHDNDHDRWLQWAGEQNAYQELLMTFDKPLYNRLVNALKKRNHVKGRPWYGLAMDQWIEAVVRGDEDPDKI